MWTIPTLMTLARIAAIPLIVGLFYLPIDTAERNLWATVMFVVFALTDWLDGYLARKLNQSCLLYTSPSPRDLSTSRMPSSA